MQVGKHYRNPALAYGGMSAGLGDVVAGEPRAVLLAMTVAVLFGALHALMPGHGKTARILPPGTAKQD
jgi:ABC-type nickel/cobalt efflux system permease component RcnA